MTPKSYEKKNYVFLYRGLSITRDFLLDFVINCLKDAYKESWWEKGVEPSFRPEDIETLKSQFSKRFSNPAGPSRPGTELYEILDVNYIVMLVENKNNWKNAFASRLNNDRTLLSYIREIILFRNPVAHPETGDLNDDDAFRGLNSCERLLRLINKDAASEISKIKNEMRSAWLYQAIGLGSITPDLIGVSIDIGFQRLEEAINSKTDVKFIKHKEFKQLKDLILEGVNLLRAGDVTPRIKSSNQKAFESIDLLSQDYLNMPFSTACIIFSPLPKFSPEEALRKTSAIRKELERLEREIKGLEIDKDFQRNLGTTGSEFFQNRIDQKSILLTAKREEYESIRNEVSAPVFFSVTRDIDFNIQEEIPFTVVVTVKNLGRKTTRVKYEEGFGEGIKISDGQKSFDEEIEPDASYKFSYKCYCERVGKYLLFTNRLDYAEKISGWDVLSDTKIVSKAGTPPVLKGERYYQYTQDGTEFIIQVKNVGDKIAHNVTFKETILTLGGNKSCLALHDDLFPGATKTISGISECTDLHDAILPEVTKVYYSDNKVNEFVLELKSPFSLLEYAFPTNIQCVGRDGELELVESILRQTSESPRHDMLFFEKKIIFIEGNGGVGKSKFVDEVRRIAGHTYKCEVFLEDASNKAPILRILRQVLGLGTDLVTKQEVWSTLNSISEDQDIFIQRDVLARFLTSNFEQFDQNELARLKTDILLLIGKLCEKKTVLLIFENIHEIPGGNELEFFKAILDFITTKRDLKLLICASYRPQEKMPAEVLGETGDIACIKLELLPFSRENSMRFINLMVPFPLLNEELMDFVFTWSGGNPLFIRELLRQLMLSANNYVARKGNFWFATSNFKKEHIPLEMSHLILQRAKRDAKDHFQFLQILSVVGLDFSWKLLSCFFAEYPLLHLSDDQILKSLDALEHSGFIKKRQSSSLYDLEFSFEHQIIRDEIYDEIRLSNDIKLSTLHMSIRDHLAAILIKNSYGGQPIFTDTEEHIRQIARHLLHSNIEQQFVNRDYLRNAAHIESARMNFVKALEYISCFLTSSTFKKNYLEQSQTYFEGAKILKMQGNWERAKDYLNNSLSLFKQVADSEGSKQDRSNLSARILAEQGYVFVSTKDYSKANDCLYRARLRFEGPFRYRRFFPPKEKAFFNELVEIYINLAEIWYLELDSSAIPLNRMPTLSWQWEVSSTYFRRAEMLSQKYYGIFGDNNLLITVLVCEGEIFSLKEEKDRAVQKLQSAIQSMTQKPDESKDKYSLERALSYLAEIYRERGEREAARDSYEKARKLQDELQDYYGLGISFGGIGDLYLDEGLYDKSEYYLEKAFQYQQMVGDTDRFWRTCFSLSQVNFKANRYDMASEYWLNARVLVMEKLKDLRPQKRTDIYSHIQVLAKHYYNAKAWEKALPLCLDLKLMASEDRQLARITEMLGKIYSELKDTEHAISTLNEELDYTVDDLGRADIYSSLGDICSTSKDPHVKHLADEHYKASVKLFLNNKLNIEATSIFDRYLESITSASDALRILPMLFDIIVMMSGKQMSINPRLIEQSEKKLEKFKLFKQMGDILVFAVHRMAQNTEVSNLDRELDYLLNAEQHYLSCHEILDVIGGYHKLISVYFHLNAWDKIAECYKAIIEIIGKANDLEIFKETVNEIILLEDKFDLLIFKAVVHRINLVKRKLDLSLYPGLEFELTLKLAKCFFSISAKSTDEEEQTYYQNLSFGHYDQVISNSGNPALIEVSYHDSAVLFCQLEKYEEAEKRLLQSIDLAKAHHNLKSEAHSRTILAEVHVSMGNSITAQSEFQQSIGILQGIAKSWDERVENQDQTPLSPSEVAYLRYDKGWLASTCVAYGTLLFRSNPIQGIPWLRHALEIYEQIGNTDAAKNLSQKIKYLENSSAQDSYKFIPTNFDNAEFLHPQSDTSTEYTKCASCSYIFQKDKKRCPKCNQKTCPHCGQFVPSRDEFCPECDTYVG